MSKYQVYISNDKRERVESLCVCEYYHDTKRVVEALQKAGYSLVVEQQPCVTFYESRGESV